MRQTYLYSIHVVCISFGLFWNIQHILHFHFLISIWRKKTRENIKVNGVVFDKGKTGAIKHALSSQEYSALSSILTFDEIPTKLISSSLQNRNFILTASNSKGSIFIHSKCDLHKTYGVYSWSWGIKCTCKTWV